MDDDDSEAQSLIGKLYIPFEDGTKPLEDLSKDALLAVVRMLWRERHVGQLGGAANWIGSIIINAEWELDDPDRVASALRRNSLDDQVL